MGSAATGGRSSVHVDGETGRTGNEQRTAGWAHAPQAVVPAVRSTVPHSHYCAATAVPGLGTELEVLGDDAGVGSTVCAKFAVAWAMSQLSGQSNVLLANVVYTDSFESREIACRTFNVRESISIRAEDTFLSALREMRRNSLDAYMALMECGFSSDIDRDALILQRRGIGGAAPTYFDYIPLQQMAAEVTEIVEGQKQAVSSIGQNMVDCLSPVFILEQLNDSDVRMNILADDKVISRDLALELPFIVYRFVRLARRLSMRVATARELFRDRDRLHVGSRLRREQVGADRCAAVVPGGCPGRPGRHRDGDGGQGPCRCRSRRRRSCIRCTRVHHGARLRGPQDLRTGCLSMEDGAVSGFE